MTDPGIYYPAHLTGTQLDLFLAKGWYRMGQGIFTTNYIVQDNCVFRVFWLRYNLSNVSPGKKSKQILSSNQQFNAVVLPVHITAEHEALYTLYRSGINFDPALNVTEWLYEQQHNNVFDSYMIELRDGEKLIALGIFDRGQNSIAGIMNFYHPDYKKYSPGKYLMLLKMEYAKTNDIQWYYPGYIVYGYPKFDYKLFVDKTAAELFFPELNQWCLYDPAILSKMANPPENP